ncbi:MAG: chorismate mutase [Candidatus Margulisiibacteriota bacterium]|nr:chorismate mutase [Candidatus Margulisiibacteriota bacterium]
MTCRGIRGAITIEKNDKDQIVEGTIRILSEMINENNIDERDIVSIFFSVTEDLNATFPARAARNMNLTHTPLLCFHEIKVPGGLEKCIRILMHVNSTKSIEEINHIYLEKAASLRPDIIKK